MNRLSENFYLAKVKRNNDADAFAKLYDTYVRRVYRFVYFKVKSAEDAEDITAEVFLKTWNYLSERGAEVKSFSGLVYRIARTTIIDWYRKQSRRPDTTVFDLEQNINDVGDNNAEVERLASRLEHQRVLAGLHRLKHDYQELVVLRYIEDFSIQEIVEITGKKSLTVRVMLHRALKKLESFLS